MLLPNTFEENWEVVMVVELVDGNLPLNNILHAVGKCNWKIAAVVEATELGASYIARALGISKRIADRWLGLSLVQTKVLASNTISLSECFYTILFPLCFVHSNNRSAFPGRRRLCFCIFTRSAGLRNEQLGLSEAST